MHKGSAQIPVQTKADIIGEVFRLEVIETDST